MNIALVLDNLIPLTSSLLQTANEIAEQLQTDGHNITFITAALKPKDIQQLTVQPEIAPLTARTTHLKWKQLNDYLKQLRQSNTYDIIHTFSPFPIAHCYQPTTNLVIHNLNEKIPAEQTVTIPLGINLHRIQNKETQSQGQKLRQFYDRSNDRALFLFVSDTPEHDGLNELIQAASQLLSSRQSNQRDFRILVFSRQTCQEQWRTARSLNLEHHITFQYPTSKLPALFNMADATILPTKDTITQCCILESLAAHTPVITTAPNAAAKIIQNNTHGYIIDSPDNIDALTNAMLNICDTTKQQSLSNHIATDKPYANSTIASFTKQLTAFYQSFLK